MYHHYVLILHKIVWIFTLNLLGDDSKVKAPNKNCHVATFPVNSGGSIIMSKIATGCSGEGEGYNGLPLTLPTTHHEKTYFTHQSKQILEWP